MTHSLSFRKLLPYTALACAIPTCIALSVALTTGFDSGTKMRQLLLRLVLITPPLIWVLRQRRDANNAPRKKIPVVPFFLVFITFVAPVSWYLRDGVYSADESAYRFEARIMRSFRAYAEAPPTPVLREFAFQNEVRYEGRWFGKYPPGWPAILAVSGWLLPDWLVSPLLGLVLLWLVYKIALRLYDERIASVTVVLMACSPFFLFLSVGYLSHIACAVFVTLATLYLLRALESGGTLDLAVAFAALGIAFLIRPFTAVCLGLVLILVLAWAVKEERIKIYKVIAMGAPIALLAMSAMLYNNALLTGHPWKPPYALAGRADVPPELQASSSNILRHALVFTPVALGRMELHSVPFVLALAVYALIRKRSKRSLALAMMPLSLIVGHMLFTGISSDSFVGERYYFEAYFVIAILAAIGWETLLQAWKPSALSVGAAVLAALCLTVYNYVYLVGGAIERRQGYAKVYELAEQLPGEKLLIFMQKGEFFEPSHFNPNAYHWQDSRVLFALDPGLEQSRRLTASVLNRPDWFEVTYNAKTGSAIVKHDP